MTDAEKAKVEPSSCTRIPKRGHEKATPPRYTEGCNERDETNPTTHEPVGRSYTRGFEMMRDDEQRYD